MEGAADPRCGMAKLVATGFGALRSECPMNLRFAYAGVDPSECVNDDLRRLEVLWAYARDFCKPSGPWLCGDYSAVDAFFAPVAARIAGYGLSVSDAAQAYVEAHLADHTFRRWRAMGLVRGSDLARYAKPFDQVPWPGPTPRPARAVEGKKPVNEACPYSGDPVTHMLETGGIVFGFCNVFCRDKTLADADAWPQFVALMDGVQT